MPLRLHAVTLVEGAGAPGTFRGGARMVTVKDLGAVVTEQRDFLIDAPSPAVVAKHRSVVDGLFRRHTVLPAPVGVVFRSAEVLTHWLELHDASLSDALSFVDGRVAARIHVCLGDQEDRGDTSEASEAGAEAFRLLRGKSVASVPLRVEPFASVVTSGAFLVDRETWEQFTTTAEEQRSAHPALRFEITGPWAPYDFVNMQFGA